MPYYPNNNLLKHISMKEITINIDNEITEAALFDLSKKNNTSISRIISDIINNYIVLYANQGAGKKSAQDFIRLMENNTISLENDNLTRKWIHNDAKNDLYR